MGEAKRAEAAGAAQSHDRPCRVVVAARSQLLSEALAQLVSSDPGLVGEPASPADALALIADGSILLLDGHAAASITPPGPPDVPVLVIGERTSDAGSLWGSHRLPFHADGSTLLQALRALGVGEDLPPRRTGRRRTNQGTRATDKRDALTPREIEVLDLLASGTTSHEIADQLGVSTHTVRTHVQNAMAKLDARSRVDAVARARRLGLLSTGTNRRDVG